MFSLISTLKFVAVYIKPFGFGCMPREHFVNSAEQGPCVWQCQANTPLNVVLRS